MNTKNIQAAGFGKKAYAQPETKAYEVKPEGIICGSDPEPASYNEEYEVVSTETTNGWFQ